MAYALLLGVLPLLFSSSLSYWAWQHEAQIRQFDVPTWAAFFVLSTFTMAFALTPTTLVALLTGYFLGWAAGPPLVLAYALASLLGYEAARRLDSGKLLPILQQKPAVRQVLIRLKAREFWVILLARLSPVLPFALSNVLFSFVKTSRRNLLIAGLLGMLPRSGLAVWAGAEARTLRRLLDHPGEATGGQFALLGLIAVSLAGLSYVLRRAAR